jgi:hypothetical protein
LFSLLRKDTDFVWKETCQHALDELKVKVYEAPVLRGHDRTLPFHISMDTSGNVVRSILKQLEGKYPYAIYYVNKNLSPVELNYTVTEK